MKNLTKVTALLLLAAMILGLAGCGAKKGLDTSITVWAAPIDGLEEILNDEVIPAFREKYPDVDVEVEMMTWEGVASKLQTALATGTTPDVYIDGTARTAMLPAQNVLEPVDDIIAQHSDWFDAVMGIGVMDGKHYLVPASTIACSAINVNYTLAKELGVADMLPEDRTSWDIHDLYDFVEAAANAGKDKNVYGTYLYAASSTSDDIIYSLMLSNGGEIIDFDTMTCVANSPECVEVVEVLGNIVKNGYAMPGAATLNGPDAATPFLNRQCVLSFNMAAAGMRVSQQEMVDQGYLDELDLFYTYGVPTPEGKSMRSASWGANCFAIFTNDGDKDKIAASKALVSEYVDNENASRKLWEKTPTYTPVRDNGVEYASEDEALQKEVVLRADWSGAYGDSSFGILESYWAEIRNCFYPEMQAVYTGEKTAQEAMDSFVANANEVLANYK